LVGNELFIFDLDLIKNRVQKFQNKPVMEITIKTDSEEEFKKIMNFLKKENITIMKSANEYSDGKDFKDFNVMEDEIKKYRTKLPEGFKFDRDEANER